ncbi:MAG: ABC transporter ATP-binding protein [Burkholderiaceae bacterium]
MPVPSSGSTLVVEDLTLAFPGDAGPLPVLRGLGFTLARGEIGCLLGESGCGKTTAMRAIAGFVLPQRGKVTLDGTTLFGPGVCKPPEQRSVGIVFQDYALFPHLDVVRNIGFGLRSLDASARRRRVDELLELVGLAHARDRFPHELSGGQQQRVALARALAPRPQVLLLDEPFSNLDPDLRERLALEVRDLLKATDATALLVTHDQHEAFAMADRIGVMEAGRIVQWDTAARLYHHPATRSVAAFVGPGSFVCGEITAAKAGYMLDSEVGRMSLPASADQQHRAAPSPRAGPVDVLLRPDDLMFDPTSGFVGELVRKAFRGANYLYTLRLPSGRSVQVSVPSDLEHRIGERLGIRIAAKHVVVFARAER